MSDEEEYDYGSDAEEYNYSDEDAEGGEGGDDDRIEIENAFYEGDDCRADDPRKACELFEKVVELEQARGDEIKWRFKALEHLVVLKFRLGDFDATLRRYEEMLAHAPNVTRNECGDSVNAVFDAISAPATGAAPDAAKLAKMYEITFAALKSANNERLWFNTNVKVGKIYLGSGDFSRVGRIVAELKASCVLPDGSDDPAKGTSLLEVYALEIQLCTATGDNRRMKKIYPKTLNLDAAVADPRIMGVIREEGGKMHMGDGAWDDAYNEFYAGFRAYQEAGNTRAKDCLKYVVLANMLALSDINPFDAREAKAYQEEKEVMAMRRLRLAYDGNDLGSFESTLKDRRNNILGDPFIMKYVESLRGRMREQVLLALLKPYTRVTLAFVARELALPEKDVEAILVDLILDERVDGKIDMLRKHLVLTQTKAEDKKYEALTKWGSALANLSQSFANRVQ
mmetsp:Transcript_28988/g.89619  ORF Transcript_28988/g.89619 Transcript_28988/m.89619 type:complete len:455 (-) Transcript_28988:33-1397(-)